MQKPRPVTGATPASRPEATVPPPGGDPSVGRNSVVG